ncbi:MAG: hypothetical protein HYZ50_15185 [Deltaproteobacteria bacterium]|nr:hypothetical protein [Deltaproteobacteria bacterium]
MECMDATLIKRKKNPDDSSPFAPNIEFVGDCNCPGGIVNTAQCQQDPGMYLTEAQTCNPKDASPRRIKGNLIVIADDNVTDPNLVGDPTNSLGKALTVVFETQLNGRTVFFAETYQNSTPIDGECELNPAECPPKLPDWVDRFSRVDEHRLRCYTDNRYIPPPRRDFICTKTQPTSFNSPPPPGCLTPGDPHEKDEGFADDNFVFLQPVGPIAMGLCKVFKLPNNVCQNALAIISPTSEVELEKQCFPLEAGDEFLPYLGKAVLFNSVTIQFAEKASSHP